MLTAYTYGGKLLGGENGHPEPYNPRCEIRAEAMYGSRFVFPLLTIWSGGWGNWSEVSDDLILQRERDKASGGDAVSIRGRGVCYQ